jgi:hypothetical protein
MMSTEEFLHPFEEGGVVYFPRADRLVLLNQTGRLVWEMLGEGFDREDVAGFLAEHFEVAYGRALHDVEQVVAQIMLARTDDDTRAMVPAPASPAPIEAVAGAAPLEDCGVFQFGTSRISVASSVPDITGMMWRFRHRSIGDAAGAEKLEISEAGSAYRVSFRGCVCEEKTTRRLGASVTQLLLKLEYPDTGLLAYCHAAAVSHRGLGVLMPGRSGAGKSTLTAFLVRNGFAYLGDDIIAIEESTRALLPLPSCLSIKSGSWQVLEPIYPVLRQVPAVNRYGRSMRYVEPQGNYETMTRAEASVIVFPTYRSGETTRLSALPPLQTMARLIGTHSTLMTPGTQTKLGKLIRFVEETPAYELTYSELPEAMQAIDDRQ